MSALPDELRDWKLSFLSSREQTSSFVRKLVLKSFLWQAHSVKAPAANPKDPVGFLRPAQWKERKDPQNCLLTSTLVL